MEGLRRYVKSVLIIDFEDWQICEMMEYFERLVASDQRLAVFGPVHLGLFCFQFKVYISKRVRIQGPTEETTNAYTPRLCLFLNKSRKLYFTHTQVSRTQKSAQVDGHDQVRVVIAYEHTTRAIVDCSRAPLQKLVDEFSLCKGFLVP